VNNYYLVTGTDSQLVENWEVDLGRREDDDGVGGHERDVLGPVHVDFGGCSKQCDGRHKTEKLKFVKIIFFHKTKSFTITKLLLL
jgi:hypothetical protein